MIINVEQNALRGHLMSVIVVTFHLKNDPPGAGCGCWALLEGMFCEQVSIALSGLNKQISFAFLCFLCCSHACILEGGTV